MTGPVPASPSQEDKRVLAALEHDETYLPVRVLACGGGGRTELVRGRGPEGGASRGGLQVAAGGSADSEDLLVRKYLPLEIASPRSWELARRVRDPHLARVLDVYALPDQLVAVSEYVPGPSLAARVGEEGPLSPDEVADLARDLCQAAEVLHGQGLIHRDIAPGNVILAERGAVLVDLGNVRSYVAEATHDTTTLGTPGFSAPEQYGFAQTDARSDVYAIGRVIQFALTGELPQAYEAKDQLALVRKASPTMARVVEKACAFEPSRRYPTAAALAKDLPLDARDLGGDGQRGRWGQDGRTLGTRLGDHVRDMVPRGSVLAAAWRGATGLGRVLAGTVWACDAFVTAVCLSLLLALPTGDLAQTVAYELAYALISGCFAILPLYELGIGILHGVGRSAFGPVRGQVVLRALGRMASWMALGFIALFVWAAFCQALDIPAL